MGEWDDMLGLADDGVCSDSGCKAHGELNRLRAEVRELREALDSERDSLHRHADVIATQRNEAYTRAERAEAELSRRGLAFDSEYQARIKAEAEVQRLREGFGLLRGSLSKYDTGLRDRLSALMDGADQ